MSATIWVNTETETTIELGPTLGMYHAFSEMARLCTAVYKDTGENEYAKYPDLFCVPSQTEDVEDCDKAWLRRVRTQAQLFFSGHRDELSAQARYVLDQLVEEE